MRAGIDASSDFEGLGINYGDVVAACASHINVRAIGLHLDGGGSVDGIDSLYLFAG